MVQIRILMAFGIVAFVAACASPKVSKTGPGVRETSVGQVLVDSSGRTLYTYDQDPKGKSVCTGACAVAWPPAEADGSATPSEGFSVIVRPNGAKQWAHEGAPLYAYLGDNQPGNVSGNGLEGVWHVARP